MDRASWRPLPSRCKALAITLLGIQIDARDLMLVMLLRPQRSLHPGRPCTSRGAALRNARPLSARSGAQRRHRGFLDVRSEPIIVRGGPGSFVVLARRAAVGRFGRAPGARSPCAAGAIAHACPQGKRRCVLIRGEKHRVNCREGDMHGPAPALYRSGERALLGRRS